MRGRFKGAPVNGIPLNFKLHGTNASHFKYIISALKLLLNTESSVGIPPHTTKQNSIQKITDQDCLFVPQFERAQKHNSKKKDVLSDESSRVNTVIINTKKSYLLCDDVLTTGQTMDTYAGFLSNAGVPEVHKFAIAHKKCEADKCFTIAVDDELLANQRTEIKGSKMARGGYRPGAGRPKKINKESLPPEVKVTDGLVTVIDQQPENLTPLEYMLRVMNDPKESDARRSWAAQSAAPYCHSRKGEGNKKEDKIDRAKAAGSSGKFAASPPPLKLVK